MLPGARLHVGAKNNLLASRCWLDSFNTITIHCPLRSRSTLQLSILWFAGVVFEDAPEGRVYVRVFVGMTVRALCECLRCISFLAERTVARRRSHPMRAHGWRWDPQTFLGRAYPCLHTSRVTTHTQQDLQYLQQRSTARSAELIRALSTQGIRRSALNCVWN